MTFNIRFDTPLDAPEENSWRDRVASVIETISATDPDIIGIQEALRSQFDDLNEALTVYRSVGKPRELGDTAEYVPLFFKAERFAIEEHGDFWLSPTPDIEGSRGWDTDLPRHCTWARLVDGQSDRRFAVFNTHLDSEGPIARSEAAKLISKRARVAPVLPTIVLGDLNASERSEPLSVFAATGLRDTYRVVHPDESDVQTAHHYVDMHGSRKIDYILCDRSWRVEDALIVREAAVGRLPSDHFPVIADLSFV